MKCPIDDSPLSVSSREGVEIDFCPSCRGVWLDRGELDKIIDRAATTLGPPVPTGATSMSDHRPEPRSDRRDDDGWQAGRRGRRRSFLDDLFDFD